MSKLSELLLAAVISGSVGAAIVGSVLKGQFEKDLYDLKFNREFKTKQLSELIGPATMHFARTNAVAIRYGASDNGNVPARQFFGDAKILKESNDLMRTLLVSKGHLIPSTLLERSHCLIIHYDIWAKLYDKKIQEFKKDSGRSPNVGDEFDVGFAEFEDTKCGNFPGDVPALYRKELDRLVAELYEDGS